MTIRRALSAGLVAVGIGAAVQARQQPIDPVDFKPFVDGGHWIVRQPLTYRIGVSTEEIAVPVGFVTDFASIPQALQSIIRQNGPYILPAVVHDYLYWDQSCTRQQADQIFLLAMIENKVGAVHRTAIYQAPWPPPAASRGTTTPVSARPGCCGSCRRIASRSPPQHPVAAVPAGAVATGVAEPPHAPIAASFCARGDMTTEEALRSP